MAKNYSTGDPERDRLVEALAATADANPDLFREMLTTVGKLAAEHPGRGELKLLNSTLKELRHAFRVFAPYRHVRKAAIFGSARIKPDDAAYHATVALARMLADAGWMVITGAGPGIMQAATEGAGREQSFGVNIRLPFEQAANPEIVGDAKLINFKYFFTRKVTFLKEAAALVMLPGGFGTLDEGFETLTLVQTGKADPKPIVLLEPPGSDYWRVWDSFIRKEVRGRGLISPEDTALYQLAPTPERAVQIVRRFYRNYHSLRFVGDDLILRLQHPIAPALIETLNARFADALVAGGRITETPPAREEANEPEIVRSLPRLLVPFNRLACGRLREMIDAINEFAPEGVSGPTVAQGPTRLLPAHSENAADADAE